MRIIACLLAFAGLAAGQQPDLYGRAVQLMESTAMAVPGLARAGEPLIENARQTGRTMRTRNHLMQDSSLHYAFLTNLRAYLALFDAFPKPGELTAEGRQQVAELREIEATSGDRFEALLKRKEAELRYSDRDNLARYREANSKLGPPDPSKPRVVFLGDSITDSWRLNEYYPESDFVNRGIGGQITGQMLGRMVADVISLRPAVVVLLGGTNDLARNVAPGTIQDNIRMIADLAEKNGIRVVLASILPVHDYNKEKDPRWENTSNHPRDQILAMNSWMQALANSRNYVYLDYYGALVDGSGMLRSELSDDGLHPNAAGYRLMSPLAWDAVHKALPAPGGRGRR